MIEKIASTRCGSVGGAAMVGKGEEDRQIWAESYRRAAAIRGPLNCYLRRLEGRAVDDVAWEPWVSLATLYRLIKRYPVTRIV